MTPRRYLATVSIAITMPIFACGPGRPDRLRADVDRYLVAMQGWSRVELEAGQAIERILATQFVDDAEVLRQLSDSRPRIQRHLYELRAYQPETEDIRIVHRQYVDAWVALLTGYSTIERGLRTADAADLSRGRTALLEWRRSLRTVAEDLRDLAKIAGTTTQKREGPA